MAESFELYTYHRDGSFRSRFERSTALEVLSLFETLKHALAADGGTAELRVTSENGVWISTLLDTESFSIPGQVDQTRQERDSAREADRLQAEVTEQEHTIEALRALLAGQPRDWTESLHFEVEYGTPDDAWKSPSWSSPFEALLWFNQQVEEGGFEDGTVSLVVRKPFGVSVETVVRD